MLKNINLYGLIVLSLIFVTACEDDDSIPISATAKYTFIVAPGTSGEVTFINTSENADTFSWDFGDGTGSTVNNPDKQYAATGDYTVTLRATDSETGSTDTFSSTVSVFVFNGGLIINGDFESGPAPWSPGVAGVIPDNLLITDGDNTYYSINVTAPGQPFFVNLSQTGLNITQGTTYRLTFDAWSDVNRSMIVGIGLSGAPFTNQSVPVNLTTSVQSFSLNLEANFTDNTNSRVLFDMGAEVGMVNIDNVTLTEL